MKSRTTYLMACLVAILRISASQGFGATYNVKEYGATGDGVSNDTVAVRNCINAANNATGTKTVYFPAGTYLVNHIPITAIKGGSSGHGAKLLDKAPVDLIFEGDGAAKSILKRNPIGGTENRVATMDHGNNITIRDLGFDANHINRWGGFAIYGSTNVTIQHVHCFDSDVSPPPIKGDHYMFVIQGSTNVKLLDTRWDDLQIEFDSCRNVQVLRNVVNHPYGTGGFGGWAVGGKYLAEDYLVQDNWFINTDGNDAGIVFKIDNAKMSDVTYRNIRVLDNTIIYTAPQPTAKRPSAIKFGVATSSGKYGNIVFDNITIAGNKIYVAPGVANTAASSYIYFNHAPAAGFKFDNTTITNNTLFADGSKPILAVRDSAKGVNWRETNNVEAAYQAPPPIPTAQERSRK